MKLKLLSFLSIISLMGSCYGMNLLKDPYNYSLTLNANTNTRQFSSLSALIKFHSEPSHLSFHSTPNLRHGNLPAITHAVSTWQTLSAAQRYDTFRLVMKDEFVRNLSEIYHTQIAQLSHAELINEIATLNKEIITLEKQFGTGVQMLSPKIQQILKECGEPLQIALSQNFSQEKQAAFADSMINLKKIQLHIEVAKNAIKECHERIELLKAKVILAIAPIIEKTSTQVLVNQEIPTIEKRLKELCVQRGSCAADSMIKINNECHDLETRLAYMQDVVKSRAIHEKLKDLSEAQALYSGFWKQDVAPENQ